MYLPKSIMYDSVDGATNNLVENFVKDELLVFPVGKHDDMIDAFSRILDKDLNAKFPKIGIVYLEGGKTEADLFREDFDESDFSTW